MQKYQKSINKPDPQFLQKLGDKFAGISCLNAAQYAFIFSADQEGHVQTVLLRDLLLGQGH